MSLRTRVIARWLDVCLNTTSSSNPVDTDTIVAATRAYLFALNRLLANRLLSGQRQNVAQEVQESLEAMRTQYGSVHQGDFLGWGALRDEGLK